MTVTEEWKQGNGERYRLVVGPYEAVVHRGTDGWWRARIGWLSPSRRIVVGAFSSVEAAGAWCILQIAKLRAAGEGAWIEH